MHPYLIELICGADMNMMLNHFCVFLYPNTPNFTRHKFLDLYFYLCFKENEINVNIPNFCPPVYMTCAPSWYIHEAQHHFSHQASLARQAFLITALHGARSKTGKNVYAKSSAICKINAPSATLVFPTIPLQYAKDQYEALSEGEI